MNLTRNTWMSSSDNSTGSWVRHFHTGSFQVPNSMRSVDGSARGQIMKNYNKAEQEEIVSENL